jgi:predicted chitinase
MNLFGKNKKDTGEDSPNPVVSEKTKDSASFLKKTVNKIGDVLHKKFGSTKHTTDAETMSNTEYLGEIYKLMVQNHDDAKLEHEQQVNSREEEDTEDQKRHEEIIKALTIRRRPKPKRVAKREKKAEEKAKKTEEPAKPGEPSAPSKPSQPPSKPAESAKPPQKPAETKPAESAKPPQKPVETKPAEPAKPKTAKPVKETPKQPPAKPAEPIKPPESVKPPTATQKPLTPAKPPVTTAAKLPKGMTAAAGPIIGALLSAGITNVYAQRAILANVEKETGGNELEENLLKYKNTSNKRIREIFTKRVEKYSDSELDEIKKDPYKFGELVYGKNTKIGQSMGNTEEGDGYKYRGRGYIQLTGKNNYKEFSKAAGTDLIKNPDALLQPDVAAKVSAEFVKRGNGKKGLEFSNQQEANRAVTQAIGGAKLNLNEGYGAELLSKVEKNSKNYEGVGNQIDQSSKDNNDMKKQEQTPPPIVNQSTTNVTNTTNSSTNNPVNDRPKHDRK